MAGRSSDTQAILSSCRPVRTALRSIATLAAGSSESPEGNLMAKLSGLWSAVPTTNTFWPGLVAAFMCPQNGTLSRGKYHSLLLESPRSCLNAHHLVSALHCVGHGSGQPLALGYVVEHGGRAAPRRQEAGGGCGGTWDEEHCRAGIQGVLSGAGVHSEAGSGVHYSLMSFDVWTYL